jgi:hypothetical protein
VDEFVHVEDPRGDEVTSSVDIIHEPTAIVAPTRPRRRRALPVRRAHAARRAQYGSTGEAPCAAGAAIGISRRRTRRARACSRSSSVSLARRNGSARHARVLMRVADGQP